MNIPLILVWLRGMLWPLLRTLGQVLGTLLMQLLTGKALKQLLLWPLEKLSKKTKTDQDDKVVEKVKEDWALQDKPSGPDASASGTKE